MQTNGIIEGLTILEKYRDDTNVYNIGAEHDIIYAYATDKPVEEKDLKRLIELGWFQEDCLNSDGEFTLDCYSSEEGWCAYV